MSRVPKLPYATPEETLEAISRPGFEVTDVSRFDVDRERCAKCGRRGGRTDCATCRILNAQPHERGPYPAYWDNGPDYNPRKAENWLGPLRYNGQRVGDPVHVRPACAKCGHANPANLRQVGETYECVNTGACESMVRVTARLRLVKVDS